MARVYYLAVRAIGHLPTKHKPGEVPLPGEGFTALLDNVRDRWGLFRELSRVEVEEEGSISPERIGEIVMAFKENPEVIDQMVLAL